MKRILLSLMMGLCHRSITVAEWVQWNSGAGHNSHFYRAVALPGGIVWSNANSCLQRATTMTPPNWAQQNLFVAARSGTNISDIAESPLQMYRLLQY